jgi:hypothetical protein
MSLLPRLKKVGYRYLALEINEKAQMPCHSQDMMRFYTDYMKHRYTGNAGYPYAKPGWIDLTRKAIDLRYEIVFIDSSPSHSSGSPSRDKDMFEKMQKDIFDVDKDAKVVVYIGAHHVSECETDDGVTFSRSKRRPLGLFLEEYTKGKNLSVYMGHPFDTPVGCDLFISDFIWNTRLNCEP